MFRHFRLAFIYIKKYPLLVTGTLLVMVVCSLFEGIGIGLLVPILEIVEGKSEPTGMSRHITHVFSLLHINFSLLNLLIIFGIVMLCKYTLFGLQTFLSRYISSLVTCRLRQDAFSSIMNVPLPFFYHHKTGDIIATIFTSAINSGASIEHCLIIAVSFVFAIMYIALATLMSLELTLVAFSLILISSFLIIPRFKTGYIQGQGEKKVTDEMNSYLYDSISGVKTVKTFGNESLHIQIFNRIADSFRKVQIHIQNNRILVELLMEPVVTIIALIIIGYAIISLNMPAALLITFFYILSRVTPKIKMIQSNWLQVNNLVPHFSRVQEFITLPSSRPISQKPLLHISTLENIVFQNVTFSYDPSYFEATLSDISFSVTPKTTVALVGTSGGGKSTLVDLIIGHVLPTSGVILINDTPLQKIDPDSLKSHIGMVEQTPHLFHESIMNNIKYGNTSAPDENVFHAAVLAHAHQFIENLPNGYSTIVGERGICLSGGQKQRICLARALLKDPDLLILDEATSALDTESEKFIQESIKTLSKKKTLIIIAHRLSTITEADHIIVLEKGTICEQGNHADLLKIKGKYSNYLDLQSIQK